MKKYYQAFQAKGTNALKLNFDPTLNVSLQGITGYLCLTTLTPLVDARAGSTVKCPLCGSISQKTQEVVGKTCETCQLCKLGEDAMGLTNMIE
jgi:hypothetical protein